MMGKMLDIVKNKKVKFTYYADKELWYITECGFEFPVPITDIGNATFLAEDKAIYFMRYIRKYINVLETAKENQHKLNN